MPLLDVIFKELSILKAHDDILKLVYDVLLVVEACLCVVLSRECCHARLVSLPNQCRYPFAVSWLVDTCCCDWISLFN